MAKTKIIDKDKTENCQIFIEKQYDYFVDMIKQSQQATIDSFIKLSSILFLLNGSAAAALFSMQRDFFSVLIFALGAMMAAGGLLIFHQRCITITKYWQTRLYYIGIQKTEEKQIQPSLWKRFCNCIKSLDTILAVGSSLFLFWGGLMWFGR